MVSEEEGVEAAWEKEEKEAEGEEVMYTVNIQFDFCGSSEYCVAYGKHRVWSVEERNTAVHKMPHPYRCVQVCV